MTAVYILIFLAGAALGAGVFYFIVRKDLAARETMIKLQAEKDALLDQAKTHRQSLEEMEQKFTLHFENLANKIFEEKTNTFKKQSREGLDQILSPLKEKLNDFQKKIEDSSKEQFSLKNEIANIVAVNQRMTKETENLTRALKGDVKTQGNWGEVVLEKILDMAGLRKDVDYIVQGTGLGIKNEQTGQTQKPDVVVMLPEDKHVIIDSKVSLNAYERYCAAGEDEAARAVHLKDFITSVKNHVQGLDARRYQDTDKLGTPDFVLMFMPIEGAYALAMQNDAALYAYAWDKRVAIVCPSTLFISLRTIASLWRIETQKRHTLEIARQGGALYDKVASFVEDMQDIGKKLGATQKVFDNAFKKLSSGQGNIIKRTQDLQALGVKASRKLPIELIEAAEEDSQADHPANTVENA